MYFDSHSDIWWDVTQQLELGNTDVFNKRHLEKFRAGGIEGSFFVIWVDPPQLYPCMSNYKHGVDDLIIQKEFGHKDLRTTQQCYCYDLTTDEERYEKIAQSLA